jgi:hypothetical protein
VPALPSGRCCRFRSTRGCPRDAPLDAIHEYAVCGRRRCSIQSAGSSVGSVSSASALTLHRPSRGRVVRSSEFRGRSASGSSGDWASSPSSLRSCATKTRVLCLSSSPALVVISSLMVA